MWLAARAALAAFGLLALLGLVSGQQIDPFYPHPRPSRMPVPLSFLRGLMSGSVCGSLANFGCVTRIDLQVELPPLVYDTPPPYLEVPRCIGWDSRCMWPNITSYLNSGADDTDEYILTGLNITLPTASQAFLLGSRADAAQLTNYLTHINVTCHDAYPVYAKHIIDKIIDMASGVAADGTFVGSQGPVLQSIVIRSCLLTGGVPASLSKLRRLEYLDLSGNHLDGGLAPEWNGPSMRLVNLSSNALSGLLPSSGSWVRLGACGAVLDLSNNDLHGGIPSSWLDSACSSDGKTNTSVSSNNLAAVQQDRGGPYAVDAVCSLPNPTCNIDGIALDQPSASDPLIQTAIILSPPRTPSGSNPSPPSPPSSPPPPPPLIPPNIVSEGGASVLLSPFPFSVLLYGNPSLERPTFNSRYAVAFLNGTRFSIASNACTDSGYTVAELVGMWVAAFFGGMLIGALPAATVRWRRPSKVVPADPSSTSSIQPSSLSPSEPSSAAEIQLAAALGAASVGGGADAGGSPVTRSPAALVSPSKPSAGAAGGIPPPSLPLGTPADALSDTAAAAAAAARATHTPAGPAAVSCPSTAASAPAAGLVLAIGAWHVAVVLGLVLWYAAFTGTTIMSTATLAAPQRRFYCTQRMPCLPDVYLAPILLLLMPMGVAALLMLMLIRVAQERFEIEEDAVALKHKQQQQQQQQQQRKVAGSLIEGSGTGDEKPGQLHDTSGKTEAAAKAVPALDRPQGEGKGQGGRDLGEDEASRRPAWGAGVEPPAAAAAAAAAVAEGQGEEGLTGDSPAWPSELRDGPPDPRGVGAGERPQGSTGAWAGDAVLAWREWRVLARQHLCPTWGDVPVVVAQWAVLALCGTFALPLLIMLGIVSQLQLWTGWAWCWVWYEPPPPPSPSASAQQLTSALRLLHHRMLWLHIEGLAAAMYLCTGLLAALPLAVVMGYLVAEARNWGLGSRLWYVEVRAMFFVAWFTLGAVAVEAALGWVVARHTLGTYPAKLAAAWAQRRALSAQQRQVQRQLAAEATAVAAAS